jgi:hypothetical protein
MKGSKSLLDMFYSRACCFLFTLFSLLPSVIFPAFNVRWVALASPLPPQLPSDDEIFQAFLGVGPDETLLTSEIVATRELYDQFSARYGPKKSLEDAFPYSFLAYKEGQSQECYNDFIMRCCRIFAEQSSGDVFLFSRWPNGPSNPNSLFNAVEFPAFRSNPDVRRIYLVNPDDMSQRIQFWPRDLDDPNDSEVEIAPEDRALEETLDMLTVTAGAAAGGLAVLQSTVGSSLAPYLLPGHEQFTPYDSEEQAPEEMELDSFFLDTASFPGDMDSLGSPDLWLTGDSVMMEDSTHWFTMIPEIGAETFTSHVGDGDVDEGFSAIGGIEPDTLQFSSIDESTDVFGSTAKRQVEFYPHACAVPAGLERDLSLLFEKFNPLGGTNFYEETDPPTLISFPGALPARATVHVVQRRLPETPGFYKLDIEIRNSGDQVIGSAVNVDAFANQRIEVESELPYRVQVWIEEVDDYQPLIFQYGPTGLMWDSNDSNPDTHDCETDEWRADHRELQCKFYF